MVSDDSWRPAVPLFYLTSTLPHNLYPSNYVTALTLNQAMWACTTATTTILRPFFRDHPREPVPEENFWTLWCKGRLTEADTLTILPLGAIPSGLTNAHLHHPPIFFTGRMPFLPPT